MRCAVFHINCTTHRAIYANYCLLEGAVKNISNPFGGIRGHYVSTNKRNGK